MCSDLNKNGPLRLLWMLRRWHQEVWSCWSRCGLGGNMWLRWTLGFQMLKPSPVSVLPADLEVEPSASPSSMFACVLSCFPLWCWGTKSLTVSKPQLNPFLYMNYHVLFRKISPGPICSRFFPPLSFLLVSVDLVLYRGP